MISLHHTPTGSMVTLTGRARARTATPTLIFFAATINTAIEQSSRPRIAHEWEKPGRINVKPSDFAYGYMTHWRELVECSDAEELLSKVTQQGVSRIKLVWTPETPQPVYPEQL